MNDKGIKSSYVKSGKRYNVIMSHGLYEYLRRYSVIEELGVTGSIASILLDEFYREYEQVFCANGGSLITAADLNLWYKSYNEAAKNLAPLNRKQVSFILPAELSDKIEKLAKYTIMSRSDAIRALLYSSYTKARI